MGARNNNATRSPVRHWLAVTALIAVSGCAKAPRPLLFVPTASQPCPPWLDTPAARNSGSESDYWRCANAVNLRNMVERPEDLENGRPLGPASGEREALGVKNYNAGKVKPFEGGSASEGTYAPLPTPQMTGSPVGQ